MALDEDLPDRPEDKTIPKYRQIAKVCVLTGVECSLSLMAAQRAGEYIESWTDELDKQFRIWQQENRGGNGSLKRPGSV